MMNRSLIIQFFIKIVIGTKRNYEVDEFITPHTYDVKNACNTYQDQNFNHFGVEKNGWLNASKNFQCTGKSLKDVNFIELPKYTGCLISSNFSNEKFYNGVKPFDDFNSLLDCQVNQNISNLHRIDFDDSEEILKHLDNTEFVEPSKKELDECSPVTLDFDSLNELLNESQIAIPEHKNNSFMQLQVDNQWNLPKSVLYDVSDHKRKKPNFDIKEDDKNEFNSITNVYAKILTSLEHNEKFCKFETNLNDIINPKNFFSTLKSYIERFICENISYSLNSTYLTRLNMINEGLNFLDSLKLDSKNNFYKFDFSDDSVLVKELINVRKSFDEDIEFNQETYDKFSNEFDLKIFNKFYTFKCWFEVEKLSIPQKKLFFYSELTKHYKIVAEIPEILVLGGIYADKNFFNLPFIMRSINLFAEKIGNVKNNRIFILCMIYKALKCFRTHLFDFFLIPYYGFLCNKKQHDLTFFTLEMNTRKRQSITRRKTRIFEYNYNDEKYLRTIFLIYLYQYSLFIKFYNINSKNFFKFKRFVDKVIKSDVCLGCLFDEYLIIVDLINKEVFLY